MKLSRYWEKAWMFVGVALLLIGGLLVLYRRLDTSAYLTEYLVSGHYDQWIIEREPRQNMIGIMLDQNSERLILQPIGEQFELFFGENCELYWISQYGSIYDILTASLSTGRGFQVVGVVKGSTGSILSDYVVLKVDIKLSDPKRNDPATGPYRKIVIDSVSRGSTWSNTYMFESQTYKYWTKMSVHVHMAAIKSTLWGRKVHEYEFVEDSIMVNVVSGAKITVPDEAVIDSLARNDPFRMP